jgi:hypothetical protein
MSRQPTKELILANYPIFYLKEDEVTDPLLVIKDFFSNAHLPEVRDMLWLSLKTTVIGSFPDGEALNRKERYEIVFLYEQLIRLVEAAHLINEKTKLANLKTNES